MNVRNIPVMNLRNIPAINLRDFFVINHVLTRKYVYLGSTGGGSGAGHGGSGGRGSAGTTVGVGYDSLFTPSHYGSAGGFGRYFSK